MLLNETYTLSNGLAIPKIGLGTWLIPDNEVADADAEEHGSTYDDSTEMHI